MGPNEALFEKMVKIAQTLPWSNREAVYAGLSRIVMEQIMTTSLSSALRQANGEEAELKRSIKQSMKLSLRDVLRSSGGTLTQIDTLVEIYVDGFSEKRQTKKVHVTGDRCMWTMGCPGIELETLKGTSFEQFGKLEEDHFFPSSRRGSYEDAGIGQMLCRYHNIFWKGPHIAFALDDYWLL